MLLCRAATAPPPKRRELLGCILAAPLLAASPALASTDVGSYLPLAGVDDFVRFVPDRSKTPGLRAGTVDREHPYSFALPPTWSERKVANIQSGNYCQPRCAEPWTEVIFGEDLEGKASVVVSPLVRLTNVKGANIEDIGDPQGILAALGPFITGTYLDAEDVSNIQTVRKEDGLTYYYYDIYAPYGLTGPHLLSSCTVKGDLAMLFTVAASDKQWPKAKAKLSKMRESFKA
jgi:hypothetical protein